MVSLYFILLGAELGSYLWWAWAVLGGFTHVQITLSNVGGSLGGPLDLGGAGKNKAGGFWAPCRFDFSHRWHQLGQ